MRRINSVGDETALKILKEGAENASGKSDTDKKLAQLREQVQMLQYALANVFKTLGTYPSMKAQVEGMDYRTIGIIRAIEKLTLTEHVSPTFSDMVEECASEVRIETFNELSDLDDKEKKLVDAPEDAVTENHFVILTSECKEYPDHAIFRSKMDVGAEDFKTFKDVFLGKRVGDKFDSKIQGKDHSVTILGLRRKPDVQQSQE